MRRRNFLKLAASAGASWATHPIRAAVPATPIPIIDAHIHLFDPSRPGGIPWPEPSDSVIYKPALPDRYERITAPLGVVGAIAVEASPLLSDNDWVLQVAAKNPVIVGVVGDLIPGAPDYAKELERLHTNPLFVGIRYGNLWKRDLGLDSKNPGFISGLKLVSEYGLELDSANPDNNLIRAIVEVSDQVPELRIVIDHLPAAPIPPPGAARNEYWSHLRHCASNPNIFIKLSEIPVRVGKDVQKDPAYYRERLDDIWNLFGEDRILYGSDWPNSDHLATYADTLALVRGYVMQKGNAACQKFFWKNSIAAYKWRPRNTSQKNL
ncbi:amidohydrolase family protein [Edaphobacter dinghuensis]|uniref:Amidohydrolase n=1 Tax=Edaphobacter dinghuensis TaxID=1560005 RepID=A0A917M0G8_9BACT|nr:amidohydrolase family protein [Edaphobacter dinghuensis]GGG71103.1 amidohydrolase [Edaphobacter dinghuensis]